MFFREAEIFGFHEVDLLINSDGPDDEHDRDGELEDDKTVSDKGLGCSSGKCALKDVARLEGRQIEGWIAPGTNPDKRDQPGTSDKEQRRLDHIHVQLMAD